ncbi:nuclease-related domain-containing protein [Frankia canadensis]|uniref:nuclease-related domain-containing protein n=1 Tax=Frankia canadensis TaxID=1836972 RepID=UPI00311A98C7
MNLPDGQSAAWFDPGTDQVHVLLDDYHDAALDALAVYLGQRSGPLARPRSPVPPRAAAPAPSPPASTPAPSAGWTPDISALVPGPADAALQPADDLAGNPPGAALIAKIEELTPGFWRALLDRLFRRPSEAEPWRKGLIGERAVGAELERLTGRGWRALHAIPLPNNVDIDHLLIGPGGVFTINTKNHPGAQIWVGDRVARVGPRKEQYPWKARSEARRASAALSQECGFAVPVEPVLAFVKPAKLTQAPPRAEDDPVRVRAIRHDQVTTIGDLAEMWQPRQVERIHAAARDRRTWLNA